ncbi:CoA transferase [Prescottella agglutinans]|uniref:Crotonobetainyl-CoA:carnitine CoA-transferase CaiB-like acyl-CoA transferase n=1 Tax=Prescottella agglutinans TaxID=1644129 RepID=A0ABT6MAD4_9NOCA|nr:CoA transferase [Prescottella agglutinans]MDH6281257.1 crotonobetainyl-CoA:carnitine CoA-transferase CaiB-like acyl-CoA transferase [Prescottella agglutinans]
MSTATHAYLSARLPVYDLAVTAVSAYATAANALRESLGLAPQRTDLRPDRIAASFSGDRMFRSNGEPVDGFAELSGFFRTADGWVRTHANYPHHRARLLAAVGLPEDAGRERFVRRVADLYAADIEDRAADAGAIAARVRTEREWAASEPGLAVVSGDLVGVRVRSDHGTQRPSDGGAPLAGVRVLDLTRVIAGPVASRALALLGADVLRIDPPQMPEIRWQHSETGQGKRSTRLDLRDPDGLTTFRALLADADIFLTGYRPGSLEALIGRPGSTRPGLVHGRVCAWGRTGPWAGRRGFDSIVQAASGIAVIEGHDAPGALPAQALDHASGYLLAAGVIDALVDAQRDGAGRDVDVALARTAAWLLDRPNRRQSPPPAQLPGPDTVVVHGEITAARPALAEFDDYPFPARTWGADAPRW